MPEGTLEASYCYKNSSIYFNSCISNEDLEEFAIHECLHYLQEVKNNKNQLIKMGLSNYHTFKTIGTGINEAAVQYISAKIIGIKPEYEKYYNINLFTPSPSYYPVECALLNELVFFIGEDILFKSTYFSTDDFKDAIIAQTSKQVYNKIIKAFDDILRYEETIIKNTNFEVEKSSNISHKNIEECRFNITNTFVQTQNLIIESFFNSKFNNIENLEQLENFRRQITKFEKIVAKTDNNNFFNDFYIQMMNKLEHKSNIFESGTFETALNTQKFSISNLFKKIRDLLISNKSYEK